MRCPSCSNENREGARFCDSCGADLDAPAAPSPPQPEPTASERLPADVPGEIAGRYRVKRFLGEGGRKRVYLADDIEDSCEVAVALFDTEDVGNVVRARARREAQAMRKLGDHPHVVSVLDTGEEAGSPFIVSEFMPGGDVEALLASQGGRLDVGRAVGVATDVTRALEHAHARGIVHRDLKPANVWLDEAGSARLGDFGLATTEGRARVSGGNLVGTVAYLPPEQALGEAPSPESDIYSLGALLYEMLTGRPPFSGDDAVSIISQHLHSDPVAPSRINPEVPEPLDRAVLELMAKRRDQRPAGAAAARERLGEALAEPVESKEDPVAPNPLDRLAGGVFVGRDREIERMRAAVDSAQAGAGSLQLLVGEPGIGKTRAAEELATYAQVRGVRVHWGRCREDDGAPAYWPWVQAIRELVRGSDPVAMAWQMGAGAAEIASLVPEVAEHLDIEPADLTDTEEARFRLFDSVTSFLVTAARDRPMMLVLDDLHWADEPSLLLLKYAAAETASTGLVICGTYRDVELGRHHPLARVLGDLGGDRIALRGLGVGAIERFMEMTSGEPPPRGLAEAVHAKTDGNPFFVGEVIRLLASEGRLSEELPVGTEPEIPQGVREVVGRRLDRLSEGTNEVLKVAAVVGREFDQELVVAVTDLSMAELIAAAGEAVAERLVTDLGGGRFSFSHALVRDTLYEELSAAQRARLHERMAVALEGLCAGDPDERLGELAHHFLAAAPRGDLAKAVDYAERAGVQDMEQLAYEDAVEVYERALEVMELMEEPDEDRRCQLLLALGGAEASAARFADARRAFGRAAESARALGRADYLVGAAIGIAMLSEAGRVDHKLVALIDEALAAIGPERTAARASLLSAKSQELYWIDAQGESRELVEEAIEIAREVDAPTTLAAALHRQIFVPFGPESQRERLAIADEMLDLGRTMGDDESVLRGHAYRMMLFLELADIAGFDREFAAFEALVDQLRMPQYTWQTMAVRSMRVLIDGDLTESERLAEEARRAGARAEQPLASQYYGVQLTQIRGLQGRSGELLPAVRELAERFPGIPAWRTALIRLAARSGDLELGRRELERLAPDDFSVISRDANWLAAAALVGEATATLGDARRSGWLYEELLPYEGLVVAVARAGGCGGPVDRILGLLAGTMGRQADAERHLRAALEISGRMGDSPALATTRADLAELLLRGGDREQALPLLTESLSAARGMGARGLVDRALALSLEAQGLTDVDSTTSIDEVVEAIEAERPDLSPHAAPDGTVSILFSDIEDSTILTESLGDQRWLEVLRSHNVVFREALARHDGFEVKNQGDGFMLAFPEPCRALECAIEVQRAFAERTAASEDVTLRVRMGLHTGEAIAEDGDFFGKNVILAARIAAQATGGEILVSERMREAAEGHGSEGPEGTDLRFDSGRELELKGLAGTHMVYSAEWERSETVEAI